MSGVNPEQLAGHRQKRCGGIRMVASNHVHWLAGLRLLGALAALLVGATAPTLVEAVVPPGFAVTAAVHGSVELRPTDGSPAFAVNSGAVVAPGDRIVTGPASGLQLIL